MRLDEVTTVDVGTEPGVILAVPIGSCEQHGPHLPLGADTAIATALTDALAGHLDEVVVAPPLTITASGEHAGFPGTLSIGTAAMATVIVELVRSADWAAGVVLVNGHGGNRDAVETAVEMCRHEARNVVAWWPHHPGGDAHAGRTETSLLLALRPDLVRLEAARPGVRTALSELFPALRSGGVRAVSLNGVLGDPTGATAGEGWAILERWTGDLVATVRNFASTDRSAT